MSGSLMVPVSTKIRLCQPAKTTVEFAKNLEAAGSSWITLHARHVSARRRRQGSADLDQVKLLKENLTIPVISNGNVRLWEDVERNREYTGADGIMVGENLLMNPCLFADITPDPVNISLEYLELCREHPDTATLPNIQLHIRHFIDRQCGRRPWFTKFRSTLTKCRSVDEIDNLVRTRVQKWRGLKPILYDDSDTETLEESSQDGKDLSGDISILSLLEP